MCLEFSDFGIVGRSEHLVCEGCGHRIATSYPYTLWLDRLGHRLHITHLNNLCEQRFLAQSLGDPK